ncbi:hypothetical protein DPMN_138053 [Dreissena polymorpha]|uniref:Uncharacterized protein n=1 Tax=Dreissena polymorpha TaxID=45954 RepID=A0A9D4JJF3_DREPO|nr:hypothetical protein DPMN_138053 [Dreissena polymorpha]
MDSNDNMQTDNADTKNSTANTEQTYFSIRGVKAQQVDAKSALDAASVCGGVAHFAAMLRIFPPKQSAI